MRSFSLANLTFYGTLICLLFIGIASRAQTLPDDPIAYIGHGQLFDRNDQVISPTIEFIQSAQSQYISQLQSVLSPEEANMFNSARATVLEGLPANQRDAVFADNQLLLWLLDQAGAETNGELAGRVRLFQWLLGFEDPVAKDGAYQATEELQFRLLQLQPNNFTPFSTESLGDAYIAECNASGVPTPPDIGSSQWQKSLSNGVSELRSELFLTDPEFPAAEAFVFKSTSPEGMCIALPRSLQPGAPGNMIVLDGVICLSKTTGKACFWDNQLPDGIGGTGPNIAFPEGSVVPLSQFAGGADLFGGAGGVCTGCHAGENSYLIHPRTPLGRPALNSFPLVGDAYYQPLVHPNWPQNVAPLPDADVPDACSSCHSEGGPGGRFPQFSAALRGYCGILALAVQRTMPPGAAGSMQKDPAVLAMLEKCRQAP